MKPSVLVLTPTLGNRPSLRKTIESVSSIGGKHVHHTLICPKNKIAAIHREFGEVDCLAEPEGKRGIYAALNYGFQTLGRDYKYLAFINDDDYWLPSFKELIEKMINDDSFDLVYGKTVFVGNDNKIRGIQSCSGQFKQFIPLLKKKIVLFTQQATLIKSDLYFQIGGFDEQYQLVADTKFWAQASLLDINYCYINKAFAAYTIQEGQLSSNHGLQEAEHKHLLLEFEQQNTGICPFAVAKFRCCNLPTYLQRALRKLHLY